MTDLTKVELSSWRPTLAEIDLQSYRENIINIRKLLLAGCQMMAVVKTNAYGHGILPIALEAIKCGVDRLAVTLVEEAALLRSNGINTPIHVLSALLPEQAEDIVKLNLISSVSSLDFCKELSIAAVKLNKVVTVHLKIDTGLHRFGVLPEDAVKFCKEVYHLPGLNFEGIYTHFSNADEGDWNITSRQFDQFVSTIKELNENGFYFPMRHVGGSTIAIERPDMHLDMVRTGISLFGYYPGVRHKKLIKLKPVMSLKSKIIQIRTLPPSTPVGYGNQYITNKWTKVATIPIGHGDGYSRTLSFKAEVLVRGKRVKLIGKVSLDQILVDVTHIPSVQEGDEVVLLGRQGEDEITGEELAALMKSIPDDFVAGLTARVPRVYLNSDNVNSSQ